MKYRIVCRTQGSKRWYLVQKKSFFGWNTEQETSFSMDGSSDSDRKFKTFEEAETFIADHLIEATDFIIPIQMISVKQAEKIYSKGIAEGLVGMNNLTTYKMRDFNDVLKEVLNENSK